MAGAVAEIGRHILRRTSAASTRVGPGRPGRSGPRILGTFDARLSEKAKRALERLGSEVVTGSPVTAIDATGVTLGGDGSIRATSCGPRGGRVTIARFARRSARSRRRVAVTSDLTLPGHPEVFVIGDLASLQQDGRRSREWLPPPSRWGVTRRATSSRARGGPLEPFRYRDKGSLATIGRAAAVAQFGRILLRASWPGWPGS